MEVASPCVPSILWLLRALRCLDHSFLHHPTDPHQDFRSHPTGPLRPFRAQLQLVAPNLVPWQSRPSGLFTPGSERSIPEREKREDTLPYPPGTHIPVWRITRTQEQVSVRHTNRQWEFCGKHRSVQCVGAPGCVYTRANIYGGQRKTWVTPVVILHFLFHRAPECWLGVTAFAALPSLPTTPEAHSVWSHLHPLTVG